MADKKPSAKLGDVVFFRRAKDNCHPLTKFIEFQGHGFGVLLGHVPPGAVAPSPFHIFVGMGSVGFVSFDDVIEFLGVEQGHLCLDKFKEKYNQVDAPPDQEELPGLERSRLVDASGAELFTPTADVIGIHSKKETIQ